jgi:hypothetical protein
MTVPYLNARTNTLAVVTLVLGFLFPLAAIPVGHVARRQIARSGERGDGLALAGLALGYLALAAVVIGGAVVLVLLLSGR